MTDRLEGSSNRLPELVKPQRSLSGRDRLVSNVFCNWTTEAVFIVAGFIMPRMIDRRLGQELLGIWDFAWSLLTYMDFLAVGLSSSVGRYVSRSRSLENWAELNRVVNSSLLLLSVSFCAGLGSAIGFACLAPYILQINSDSMVREAQLVLLILGGACALQLLTLSFKSVITGSGRFDIESAILGGTRILEVGSLILALLLGGGLVGLAAVVLGFQCLRLFACAVAARYICPQMSVSFRACSFSTLTLLLKFGGKSLLFSLSRMGMYHVNALLIAHFLGPGPLAVFSRQRSLVLYGESMMVHYARTLLPVASALHARNDGAGVRDLMTKGSVYGFYIALPATIVLVVMGGPLVQFWMGTTYQFSTVLGILAIGHLLTMSQRGTLDIIMAVNRHGLVGLAMLLTAVVSTVLGWYLLAYTKAGLVGSALALAGPMTVFGIGAVLVGCRIAGVSVREYLRRTMLRPMLLVIPFAVWLILIRWVCGASVFKCLIVGLGPGSTLLSVLYWHYVLPHSLKDRVTRSLVAMLGKKAHWNA